MCPPAALSAPSPPPVPAWTRPGWAAGWPCPAGPTVTPSSWRSPPTTSPPSRTASDLREAAALVHDGVTALALLDTTALKPGESVLITGASGGMGTLLVQFARALGARVVGVARGPEKTALVRELGADHVIDASDPEWGQRARAALGEGGAALVLDGVGGQLGLTAFSLTADGGRFSAHGAPTGTGFAAADPDEARRRDVTLLGIRDVQLTPQRRTELLGRVLADAAAGRLRPVIGEVFPLERAAEAHAAIEGRGLVGKVLLKP